MGYSVKEIDELASIHGGIVKLGRILRVAADTKRRFEPGADGVRILAIGCTPGGSHERPKDFRLAVQS
jgi:hypothetical protein